jgi:RND family efflux transporter MFP subunit
MKRFSLLMTALAAAVVGSSAGCSQPTAAEAQAQESAQPEKPLVRVTAGKPQRKTLVLSTTQPGRVEAFEEAPLYSKITGYVAKVLADIGDRVKKGQVLVELDVPELRDDLRQKQALVAQAEAEVRQAEAAVRSAEAADVAARARVREAEAGIGRAQGEYVQRKAEKDRVEALAASGSVTRKLVDETLGLFSAAEAARLEAAAKVESAKAALVQSEAQIEAAKADLGAVQARLKVAESNLARAETMLAYTQIKAPFDGIVTRRTADTGHYVLPANGGGSHPLLVVMQADRLRIFVDVPETEAPLASEGDPAQVRVQALRGTAIEAAITRTSWAVDPANRSLRVEIDLPNGEGLLRPGMYCTASVQLEKRTDVLSLPVTAIVYKGDQTLVCCVQSGHIVRKPVVLGLRSGTEVEIASGLGESELVVLARGDTLSEGQAVELLPAATK